jgi:hypothetical protein|tara:strand:+ start:2163 stop:2309 length:147 start_codon:yes stop_codon:yes gene_type:complete
MNSFFHTFISRRGFAGGTFFRVSLHTVMKIENTFPLPSSSSSSSSSSA